MTYECSNINGRLLSRKSVCISGESWKFICLPAPQQIHRGGWITVEGDGCQRDSTVANNDGRHTLTDFWQHLRCVQHNAVIMRMGINETRCDSQTDHVKINMTLQQVLLFIQDDRRNAFTGDGDAALFR